MDAPPGIDVSVWHSLWALERRGEWRRRARERDAGRRPDDGDGDGGAAGDGDAGGGGRGGVGRAASLRVGLTDMRLGYGLSLALAVMTLGLGAEVLRPAGAVPEGADVALTLARLYTDVLGEWMFPVFLTAAFFGMFSSAYGVLDGFPRAFEETVRRLPPAGGRGGERAVASGGGGRREADAPGDPVPAERRAAAGDARDGPGHGRLYWGFLWGTLALAVAETALLPDPVFLVTAAAVASFLLAPVTFALNYWCVTRLVEDEGLRPGRILRGWALAGILFMGAATALYLWLHVLS